MRIIMSPWRKTFQALIGAAQRELHVTAPYYSAEPVLDLLKRSKGTKKFFLFALDESSVRSGFQSTQALKAIKADSNSEVRFIKGLHAKYIVADRKVAVVTSANLTGGGLERNEEMGVHFDETVSVKRLVERFDSLWESAEGITDAEIERYHTLPLFKHAKVSGKVHGRKIRFKKAAKAAPPAGTPKLGWVVFHSPKIFKATRDKTPIRQLKRIWTPTEELDWNWGGKAWKENPRPHTLLFAWQGEIFGTATATITRDIDDEMRAKGYTFAFMLSRYDEAKPYVPIKELGIGFHRSFITLTSEMLAIYNRRQRSARTRA